MPKVGFYLKMMRLRRISVIFWCICIIAILFILYVVTDMTSKLPRNRPMPEAEDNKWSELEYKLKTIENELNQHHLVVGEMKSVVDEIIDKNKKRQRQITRPTPKTKKVFEEVIENEPKIKEYKDTGDEPPKMHVDEPPKRHVVKFNMSSCALQRDTAPKTDIQMLSLYERMSFEDIDGGAWKQGWDIEYNENQWNQKNKLKVFVVPHSHNDPGWLKTFENYYKTQTKAIFTNMVEKLGAGITRKFIWAEISYLALWWSLDATEKDKAAFRKYLESGQIEIVTGGWVMNDEANSHWLSVVQQLTTGHQWLMQNLGYTPKNAWSIDPFGYSSSQPYLLKLAGFENSVIQRVHYRVKKELALNRQLEFKWRQLWDGVGKTDMFTHMMPFYSYDVPHTCGPDPKICCQFDFKRLPGNGVSCPWGVAPLKIIQKNVRERANLILDQWRKKAQLYRSNVVLIPLGDDFRYDRQTEWDHQYQNYEMLMDFINNEDRLNAEVQFGTLEDYFREVHKEIKMSDFPVLSGDFFTYADRNQHYWSGYYTSRPFYKNMDRVLLAYVRAAELIVAQAMSSKSVTRLLSVQLRDSVEEARRALALFQHHDGITGTARNDVREDYAKKMHKAIKYSQSAIQQAAYFLLKQPVIKDHQIVDLETNKVKQDDVFFNVDDIWRHHEEIPTRITIALDMIAPSKNIVLFNALPFKRTEVFTVLVSSPDVEVFDPKGKPIMAQVSPVVQGENRLGFAANKFQLSFLVTVAPLALTVYTVGLRDSSTINKYTSYSSVRVYNADYWSIDLPKMFQVEQSPRLDEDIKMRVGNGTRIVANKNGLMQSIVSSKGTAVPVNMKFVSYGTKASGDSHSGAYLFLPDGPARDLPSSPYPEMVVTEGPFKSTLYASFVSEKNVEIVMAVTLYNNPSLPQTEVEISNTLLIAPEVDDIEVAMRFDTEIKNGDTFYTDLNGMQMIKRKYMKKIPLQANFYPLPAATYIEDERRRFTVLTSTPLGMSALQQGQIEIMQDRRLSRDDNRGLNQGVLDNIRTRHTFRVIVEEFYSPCEHKPDESYPSGQLSLGAHISQQLLLQPLVPLLYLDGQTARPAYSRARISQADLVLASFRSHVQTKKNQFGKATKLHQGMGMTLQRVYLNTCYGDYKRIVQSYPVGDGQFDITDLIDVSPENVFESTLTFNAIKNPVEDGIITLCPMEIRSLFINETLR